MTRSFPSGGEENLVIFYLCKSINQHNVTLYDCTHTRIIVIEEKCIASEKECKNVGKSQGKLQAVHVNFPRKIHPQAGTKRSFHFAKEEKTFTESEMTKNRVPNDFNKFSFDMTHSRPMKVKFLAAYYSYVSAK